MSNGPLTSKFAPTAVDAEADVIIDELRYQNIFSSIWIDTPNAKIGLKIGRYSSINENFVAVESTSFYYGTMLMSAFNKYSSIICGVTTLKINDCVFLGSSTQDNSILGCAIINDTPSSVLDGGI